MRLKVYWVVIQFTGVQCFIVFKNGQEYEGIYENGKLTKGVFTSNINGDLWTYNGEFNGNYFQGVGIERREVNNQIIIKEGDFFSDKLYQGTETILFKNSGVKIISEYLESVKNEQTIGGTEMCQNLNNLIKHYNSINNI